MATKQIATECCWCMPPELNDDDVCVKCDTQWVFGEVTKVTCHDCGVPVPTSGTPEVVRCVPCGHAYVRSLQP